MQEDLKNVKSRLSRINSYLTKIEERILVEESITTKPVATLLEEYQLIGKHQVALMEAVRVSHQPNYSSKMVGQR